ncbi:glycosyltransferase family 4 protein [Soonwooa sp.]|nr:glycosyltransferase family 4 protein [Soonwooa sp.]
MKNVFFVSELFYPNQTSTAYIMTEVAKNFAAKGNNVKVVTSKIQYDSNVTVGKELEAIEVFKSKSFGGNKNSFFSRVFSALFNSIGLVWTTARKIKAGDTVFAVTNPLFLIILLGILSKIKRFDYVLLVHDVFPENTIPAGINKKDSFVYKILLKVYNWAYKCPSKVIVLGEDMKQLIIAKGVSPNKIAIIPNWYDDELIIPDFEKPKTNEDIVIGFAGNIGRVQALERFINIFNKTENSNLRLEIIGEGANLESCKELATKKNIYFRGSLPRSEQSDFINGFDIGLISLSEGMFGLGVPSKTYNLLAMGKPVLYIGDQGSEIDMLNNVNNIGWSFSWNEENEILRFLNSLQRSNIQGYMSRNQNLAKEKFSSNVVLDLIYNFVSH